MELSSHSPRPMSCDRLLPLSGTFSPALLSASLPQCGPSMNAPSWIPCHRQQPHISNKHIHIFHNVAIQSHTLAISIHSQSKRYVYCMRLHPRESVHARGPKTQACVGDADSRTRRCNYIQKHTRTHIDTSTPRTIVEPAPCHITQSRHGGTV